ncbi:MAG: Gfo/Idh/MocA family oxidoreductase [Acidobacteria bacterium]|nr:Gfo/Idh/MocA family oxidoreductase [Acidobacteriota bacterium]
MNRTRRALLASIPLGVQAQERRTIRVGLAGLDGHPGEVSGPIPRMPGVELVAISDPDPGTVARYARSAVAARAAQYADWRQMVDREKLDIVGVCNANSLHAEAIIECLGRGIHLIAEKPVATEEPDLNRVRDAVQKSKAKFTSILPMRFSPPYLALKQIVESGEIGEILQMDAQKSYKVSSRAPWFYKRQTYGGTMAWIGIHMIDLMLAISGRDFTEAFGYQNHIGWPETGDTENITATTFRLDNGGVALLRMDYLRPKTARTHGDDRLRLAGTKGVAEYMEATGVTVVSDTRERTVIKDLPPAMSVFTEFLAHIYEGKPAPIDWKQIYRGHLVALRAREAMEKHRPVKT